MDKITRHPELGMGILALTVARLRWLIARQEDQAHQPLEVRMARQLLHLSETMGDTSGTIGMSQSDLADHVGVSREVASKLLADWQRRGLVELGRRKIKISDRSIVLEISDGPDAEV